MQPRDRGQWWADQHGTEWSAFSLWKETTAGHLVRVLTADGVGARLYRRGDELLHLVRIPPPDASAADRWAFDDEATTMFSDLSDDW